MATPEPDVSCFSPDVTPAPPIMLVKSAFFLEKTETEVGFFKLFKVFTVL
jgi:hypothetical protein